MDEPLFSDLADSINGYTGGYPIIGLTVQVFLVVLLVVVFNFLLRRFLAKLEEKTLTTSSYWDNALIGAVRTPATWLAWIVGLSFAVEILQIETKVTLLHVVEPVRIIGVVGCLTWFVIRFIGNVQHGVIARRQANNEPVDVTTVDAIGKLLRVSVLITAVLVGMQSLGFSISGVLAFGGLGGLAVSFAAKDLLANFFGGLMVYLDRPFAVGDWIRSNDRNIEGTVEEIGWRLTRIRTFDKRPLYVPNSIFTSISVENPSRMTNRRITETVGVRYDDFKVVGQIVDDIKSMLQNHPEIDTSQTLIVNLNGFGISSLNIMIYAFTKTTQWVLFHEIKHDIMLKIGNIVASHGAELAFPTQTLHLYNHDTASEHPESPKTGLI